jgi:tetratricopeptide (TPR) repeat protein
LIAVSSFSFPVKAQSLKKSFPFILFFIICVLGWMSNEHVRDYANPLALHEYDALTSPNDQRPYNSAAGMNIPMRIEPEIMKSEIYLNSTNPDSLKIFRAEIGQILSKAENGVRAEPKNPEIVHSLAVVEFTRGFYIRSEKNFLSAKEIDILNPDIPYNLGILYYYSHRRDKAEQNWLEALKIAPALGRAHLNLSSLYYESGRFEPAWEHCQKALKTGIDVPEGLVKELMKKNPE